jgi:hypothetical protein
VITEAASPRRHATPSRLRQSLVLAWLVAFVGCFAGAVFLGISYAGHPLLPGAVHLLAPAGALLMIAAVLQLSGHVHLEGTTMGATRLGLIYLATALGMLGIGMWTITHEVPWRLACLPGIAWTFAGFGWVLLHRPSRSPLFRRARARGGALWMWQAYAGIWIVFLVAPVGIAWSIGLINVK